jgi:RNA polymerase sigma-70 factor (ECF subfamily)
VVLDPSTAPIRAPFGRQPAFQSGRARPMSGTWDQDEAGVFIEELFAKHHGEIYAYLFRMMRDSEQAADMTQDAFVKAYKNYDTLEKPENARAWLYQIAHRVALDEIRRRKIVRFLPWTGESRGSAPSAEHLVMDARLSGDLQRALAKIPERQRAALLLAELHDLTGLELAAALGVSHVAARALLTRARESLRQALAAEREADAAAEAARDADAAGEAARDAAHDRSRPAEVDR